jgi:predicted O-methyltransferase YrrM
VLRRTLLPLKGESMKTIDILKRLISNSDSTARSLKRVDDQLDALVAGCANQTDLLNRKFDQVIAGLDNQSDLLNRKFDQAVAGLDNQSDLLNRKFYQMVAGLDNQSDLLGRKFDHLIEAVSRDREVGNGAVQVPDAMQAPPATLREAMEQMPLLIAERTYNTSHPGYDARAVRNFPGHLFNHDKSCENAAFRMIGRLAQGDEVPDQAWPAVLGETLVEAASVPYAAQVFERRSYVELYLNELGRKYHAHYVPGWVNFDDALFLYWLVRQVKPRTIVQTGVCNGLSAAFMMLGLVKNGPEGRLHVIDLPPVFDPRDAAWTVEGKVYGVVIPEGKTSGWLVPDAYRDRFEVWDGDAKELLPKMVDKVDSIDFFYHDSDHTYNHMMFEFQQVKRKLNKGGLVVGDDVSWNASVWDFADEFGVPSYNFKGTVGVAFF